MKQNYLKPIWRILLLLTIGVSLILFVFAVPIESEYTNEFVTESTIEINPYENYLQAMEYIEYHQYIPFENKELIYQQQQKFTNYQSKLYQVLNNIDYRTEEYQIYYSVFDSELNRIERILNQYNMDLQIILDCEAKEAYWEAKANERNVPNATKAWRIMSEDFGWNDTICAGIMGNLMAECGGCWTSDLNWQSNHSGGLGMIQWIGGRRKEIKSFYGDMPTLEEQIQFMYDEMHGTNGVTRQITKKQLDKIMNAETPEQCAYYFAIYFERCHSDHVAHRRGLARTSYNYFTS